MATRTRDFRWLTPPEREEVTRRLEAGEGREQVALGMVCSTRTIERIWAESKVKSRRVADSEHRLQFADREWISRGLAAGESFHKIAHELGRATSTISREVGGCAGRKAYRALAAQRRAIRCAERPKQGKLARWPAGPSFGARSRPACSRAGRRTADLGQTAPRPSRRSGDADQPRDDLSVPLHPVARRAASSAD